MTDKEATEISLFVRTSNDEVVEWDRRRIVDALVLEADLDEETAGEISREVERQVFASGIVTLTAPLIRELVNAKLIERGFEEARRLHTRIGFPLYDIGRLIVSRNKENANVPHRPEGTNLTLAEGVKREYALHSVFSRDVAEAHLSGDIHLHKLGHIDRPYCSSVSLEYVKKFGLSLPGSSSAAKPARHADVLLAHMVRFSAVLQGNFAASLEWDAVNFSFAPYLAGRSDAEVGQLAQRLVYEFSQLAFAKGGQTMFTDINLYWDLPPHLQGSPVIGPGGEPTGKGFADYRADAGRFLRALMEVFREGDAAGRPFFFPRPIFHVTGAVFEDPEGRAFLLDVCMTAAEKGNVSFVFDRAEGLRVSSRYRIPAWTGGVVAMPWETRWASIGTVTLNLPRLGYRAERNDERLFSLLTEEVELAAKAQTQKKDFIEKLLAYGDEGPLSFLAMKKDGHSFLRMDQAVYPVGVVGLNELALIHRGSQLHESPEALRFGLKVVTHLRKLVDGLGKKLRMRLILEQTPAESTAYRFARLDLRSFAPRSGRFICGDISRGGVYYTNSTQFGVKADVSPMERVEGEGRFHPFIAGTVNTSIWLGEGRPPAEVLASFVERTFRNTSNDQITFSPDFTSCTRCLKTFRGHRDNCPLCGSQAVEKITRIPGYCARVSDLNRGKLAELKDSRRIIF